MAGRRAKRSGCCGRPGLTALAGSCFAENSACRQASCVLSTGRSGKPCRQQNVHRRVPVTIQYRVTVGALPHAHVQRFLPITHAAHAARLTGRSEPVNRDNLPAPQFRVVVQLREQCAPRRIVDTSAQSTSGSVPGSGPAQPGDGKPFDSHSLALAEPFSGDLPIQVQPGTRNFRVQLRDSHAGFVGSSYLGGVSAQPDREGPDPDYCRRCDVLVGLPGFHAVEVAERAAGLRVVVESPPRAARHPRPPRP